MGSELSLGGGELGCWNCCEESYKNYPHSNPRQDALSVQSAYYEVFYFVERIHLVALSSVNGMKRPH